MKEKIEQRVFALFLVMAAILVYVSWAAVNNIQESIKSTDWVNKTYELIVEANAVVPSLQAGDAALRGYLLTGDIRDQAAYRVAYADMAEHFAQTKALTRFGQEKELQNPPILEVEQLVKSHVDFAGAVVRARQQSGAEAALKLLAAHPDIEATAQIQRLIAKMTAQENSLLRDRDRDAHLQEQRTRFTIYLGACVNVVLLAFVLWLMRDDLAARRRNNQILEQANATLEARVRERTAELVKSNSELKEENLERRWSHEALEHQLRYSQLIVNSVDELVFVVSRALNISRINPAVSRVTQWEPQELIAQSLRRALQLSAGEMAAAPQQDPLSFAMRQAREIHDHDALLLARSGQSIPVRYSLFPLRDQDKVVGAVITVRLRNGAPPAV